LEGYSKAIDLNPLEAVYWANRAAAHLRLEEFGSALADATKAIELNPKYIKASRAFPNCPQLLYLCHSASLSPVMACWAPLSNPALASTSTFVWQQAPLAA
jgi:tetratricopeptide (TPR) repeat protein